MNHPLTAPYSGADILCSYAPSRLSVRGPMRSMHGDYLAFLGGTETFGRFIPAPFPSLIEDALGIEAVNLGCVNAGIDAYWRDDTLIRIAQQARAVVIQIVGAHNLSNRFYTVHPRRNDRFIMASDRLVDLYPEVDFTHYSFTRHLLGDLRDLDPVRFEPVRAELRTAWTMRMRSLIERIARPVVLLWFADQAPTEEGHEDVRRGTQPLFVTVDMLRQVTQHAVDLVEICPGPQVLSEGTSGMQFDPEDAPVAEAMMGVAAHDQAAAAVAPYLAHYARTKENGRTPEGTPVSASS